jgi:predicted nucleotidyltransferase
MQGCIRISEENSMIPWAVLEEFAAQIASCYAAERIILFGSQARGDARPDSDADILIIMPFDGSGLRKSVEILVRLSPKFQIDLITRRSEDVRRSYADGDPLIGEALEEGIVLYERDGEGVAA